MSAITDEERKQQAREQLAQTAYAAAPQALHPTTPEATILGSPEMRAFQENTFRSRNFKAAELNMAGRTLSPDELDVAKQMGLTLPSTAPTDPVLRRTWILQAQAAVNAANLVKQHEDQANQNKSWMESLLDPDNENKIPVIENVWDGFLAGMRWFGEDLVAPALTSFMSALPGGPRTVDSWDEAKSITPAQMFGASVAHAGVLAPVMENTIGRVVPFMSGDFDVYDEAQRKAAYEDDSHGLLSVGRIASGLGDAAIDWYTDPFVIGGKALKAARWMALSRPITDADQLNHLYRQVDDVTTHYAAEQSRLGATGFTPEALPTTPAGEFFRFVADPARPLVEKMNHPMLREASNSGAISSVLHQASQTGDLQNVADAFLAMAGKVDARARLAARAADLYDSVRTAESNYEMLRAQANVRSFKKAIERTTQKVADTHDNYHLVQQLVIEGKVTNPEVALTKARNEWLDSMDRLRTLKWMEGEDWFMRAIRNKEIVSPEEVQAARNLVQQAHARDPWLKRALDEEYVFVGSRYNIAPGSLSVAGHSFGPLDAALNRIGVMAERGRANRAVAKARSDMTSRSGRARLESRSTGWKAYTGWTEGPLSGGPASRLVRRTVNVMKWASRENPAGMLVTQGAPSLDMMREAYAGANRLRMYAGEARAGAERGIGGVEGKQRLLDKFGSWLGDDVQNAEAALRYEQWIYKDMADFYGMTDDEMALLKNNIDRARTRLATEIKDNGFYVDENGNVVHVPWLESHVANVHILPNFELMEKRIVEWIREGRQGRLGQVTGRDAAIEIADDLYQKFNDLWRPAVLLRFGYTQRNVFEGLTRAALYESSFRPFTDAMRQGWISTARQYRKRYAQRNFEGRLAESQPLTIPEETRAAQDTLQRAVDRMTEAFNSRPTMLDNGDRVIRQQGGAAERLSVTPQHAQAIVQAVQRAVREVPPPISIGKGRKAWRDFEKWRGQQIASMHVDMLRQAEGIREIGERVAARVENHGWVWDPVEWESFVADYQYLNMESRLFGQNYATVLEMASSPKYALEEWKRVGSLRASNYGGTMELGPNGQVVNQALSGDYAPVAFQNLSAESTRRATLELRMTADDKFWMSQRMRHHTNVEYKPNGENSDYWNAMTTQAEQVRSAKSGLLLLDDTVSTDEIAAWLLTSDGKKLRDFLNTADGAQRIDDVESARAWAEMARGRVQEMFPTPEVRAEILHHLPTPSEFRTMLEVPDTVDALRPLIGSVGEVIGSKGLMDLWRLNTDRVFNWIGTIPEDTLVRAPFYGRRYQETLRRMYDMELAQIPGDTVPLGRLNAIMRASHERALKETKNWLFTIDRKTNLGRFVEYVFPFTSAAQNSFTVLKRLGYKNPDALARAALIWQSPTRSGVVDEDGQGNLVFAVDKSLDQKAMAALFGGATVFLTGDYASTAKIRKAAIMSVFFDPSSELPVMGTPNALVQVAFSEAYKHGFLNHFGDLGNNPTIQSLVFGPGRGASMGTGSADLLLPPAAQKLAGLVFSFVDPYGQGNRTYSNYLQRSFQQLKMEDWVNGGNTPDSVIMEQAVNQARHMTMMGLVANLTAFTPPQYDTWFQPFADYMNFSGRQAKKMGLDQQQANREAMALFGPEITALASMNGWESQGLNSTLDTVHQVLNFDQLPAIAASGLLDSNPGIIDLFIPYDTDGEYNQSARAWLASNNRPGTGKPWAAALTPIESYQAEKERIGRIQYNIIGTRADALLTDPTSRLSQDDVARWKADQVQALLDSNAPFARAYERGGSSGMTLAALEAMRIAQDNGWDDGPDGNSAAYIVYMGSRSKLMEMLQARKDAGGAGTLVAKANGDLLAWWQRERARIATMYKGWGAVQDWNLRGDLSDIADVPGGSR